MTAVDYAHPTISPLAIADGMFHIGGLPVGLLADRADTPTPAGRVSFAGPGKTPVALSRAAAARVMISLELEPDAFASRVPRSVTLQRSFRPAPTG